ncbi:MAG: GH92 family glycosyl hydrolase [Kiritimatiellia bacterium]
MSRLAGFGLFALTILPLMARDCVDFVKTEIGTDYNGHTFPGAAYPFGLVQASPDTGRDGWGYCAGYRWNDREIRGFSQTHLSGTGCTDLGDYRVMPYAGPMRSSDFGSDYDKASERRNCGYYAVTLKRNNVRVETTVTPHCAIYRFTNLGDGPLNVLFDDQWGIGGGAHDQMHEARLDYADGRRLSGTKVRHAWVRRRMNFALEFDRPWSEACELPKRHDREEGRRVNFRFDVKKGGMLMMKFSYSTVSPEGARGNLARELPGWDFDRAQRAVRAEWERLLSRVTAQGTDSEKTIFYTALYRTLLQPVDMADVDGNYCGADDRVARARNGRYYSTFSFWDTYRAAHPLYTILVPERVDDFVESAVTHGETAGFLPIWALMGKDNQCMIGTHSVPVIVDAIEKGLYRGDPRRAYRIIRDTLRNRHEGRQKENWDELDRYGYYPFDHIRAESVSRLLECAVDDWCAARLAARLGFREDAAFFDRRAGNWRNVYDAETGFMRGRDSKGAWRTPFSPFTLGHDASRMNDFTEGNAWQWTWHVMHDPSGLIETMGGREKAADNLERLFVQPAATAESGFTSDVTGLIGQYAHGNEPSHHIVYFFQHLGRPWRTAELVREICDRYYLDTPDGLSGNEDCGQMSAWYLFAAMGFYPFNPASGEYVLGAPQLPEVSIKVGDGRVFKVVAKNLSKRNLYVKAVKLNGRPLKGFVLRHADIMKGGCLEFEMADESVRPPKPEAAWAWLDFRRPVTTPVIAPRPSAKFDCPMGGKPVAWEKNDTFNPAATLAPDGRIAVLYRAEDDYGEGIGHRTSRIGLALSEDGVTFERLPTPVMYPQPDNVAHYERPGGCEDPRVVATPDGGYLMMYTMWNRDRPRLGVATSRDLRSWVKHGPAFARAYGGKFGNMGCKSGSVVTELKEGRLVAARIAGRYWMYWGEDFINVATSRNLVDWQPMVDERGELLRVVKPRPGYFDSALTECGPPAVITGQGILLLYNGKNKGGYDGDRRYAAGSYCGGQLLFDRADPTKVLGRLDKPFFTPELAYEKSGQYPDGTVFLEGLVPFNGHWYLYYGCADSRVGVAVR